MLYYKYSISCENTEGRLIGFVVYCLSPDIVTVVEYIEATKGYHIKGLIVSEEHHNKKPVETSTAVLLHEEFN